MLEFDFEIHRIEGAENKAADLLSRIANKHNSNDKNKTNDEIIQEVIQEEKNNVIVNHYHSQNRYQHHLWKKKNSNNYKHIVYKNGIYDYPNRKNLKIYH